MTGKYLKFTLQFVLASALIMVLSGCMGMENPTSVSDEPCQAPTGIELSNIQSAVDWINAMDKPLTLPCFVQSLPRPLKINTSDEIFSAQPAFAGSPRVFFMMDKLILSVALNQAISNGLPAELQKHALELSYLVENDPVLTTIKGDIKFPIRSTIPDSEPFRHIIDNHFDSLNTECGTCHSSEQEYTRIDNVPVYQSYMLRTRNSRIGADIAKLRRDRANCNSGIQAHRCSMYSALVDHGDLIWQSFPENAKAFED